jgi:septal ring factor EnvC (AmiA/AmiB activator)
MLHLAQVQKNGSPDTGKLQLLARQRSEYVWTLLVEPELLPFEDVGHYPDGALVLVTLSETGQPLAVQDARDWILQIIQTFLVNGITPEFIREEADRAEQWRQSLTLQSQDLDRRALELEARREQIEQLEETLKREKKQMESLAIQCKEQSQELDRRALELETHQQQIKHLEETLKREKQQMEDVLTQYELKSNPPN